MRSWLLLAAAFIAGSTFGYAIRDSAPDKHIIPFAKHAVTGDQLGCTTQASATLFVHPFTDQIEAESGRGTDNVALKIDTTAKQVSFLTAAAVRNGATEGDRFVIVHEDSRRITAVHVNNMGGVSAIIIVRDIGMAIWTKVADVLMSNAQAYVLRCS